MGGEQQHGGRLCNATSLSWWMYLEGSEVNMLTSISHQGSSTLQSTPQFAIIKGRRRRSKSRRILRSLRHGMGRRRRRHATDQTPWRKHVSPRSLDTTTAGRQSKLNLLLYRSFFQAICIVGYTLFPLVIAALCSYFNLYTIIRIPVYIVLVAWSLAAGVSILGGSGVVKNRVGIAVYPLLVFYVALGALCFIT